MVGLNSKRGTLTVKVRRLNFSKAATFLASMIYIEALRLNLPSLTG